MKFTGLVLICASSVLALLLPAIGVVKFPMANRAATLSAQPLSGGQALPGSSSASGPLPVGLPVSAQGGLPPAAGENAAVTQEGSFFGSPWTKQKLGLSAWVFLAPVMLLGLGLWTFAPNRRGLGR